jgi:hypothetical protein
MMDFIFGTLSTDELKLVHHRAQRFGLQHGHMRSPRTVNPGEPVKLIVTTGPDLNADHVVAYYTVNGAWPSGSYGQAEQGQVIQLVPGEVVWDSHCWGYIQTWEGVLPPQTKGTLVRYQIGAWSATQPEIFADTPNPKTVAESAASAFFAEQEWSHHNREMSLADRKIFGYGVAAYHPPAWAHRAIIYHLFVDRFYPGDNRNWLQTSDLSQICGGTLYGILDKLDYLQTLGINCLWLSPTWVSPSHHGYDATDYTRTEPRLGGDEALRRLIGEAHERGIRVLLDLACNHISHQHPIFQAARCDSTSPYRDWFIFDESEIGYRTFFNVASMPELNLNNPDTRTWMIEVATYWLKNFQIDGYRLDYANGPGPEFWTDFVLACKQENPETFCFGEVIDSPEMIQTYIGVLDGCLDFHLGDAFRRTYGWQSLSKAELDIFIARHKNYFPRDFIMPSFLDNHDMDRFLFIAGNDKESLKQAARHQMQLSGPPIIYYGTEVGLSQAISTREGMGLHVSRTPMVWGDAQDKTMLTFYQELIAERLKR